MTKVKCAGERNPIEASSHGDIPEIGTGASRDHKRRGGSSVIRPQQFRRRGLIKLILHFSFQFFTSDCGMWGKLKTGIDQCSVVGR